MSRLNACRLRLGCYRRFVTYPLILGGALSAFAAAASSPRPPQAWPPLAAEAADPSPPSQAVRLIFVHHSTGENWLADENGGLGQALRDNNYFVSDTNYGWGAACPECDGCDNSAIGSCTDIGHWFQWFRGSRSATFVDELLREGGQHAQYSRLASAPAGLNTIVMFKSCFPNSRLLGSPADPIPQIGSNPLRGQSSGSDYHTLANAKGIYIDLLQAFRLRPQQLFVMITAPPLSDEEGASNARALNNWLVTEWLRDYPLPNVAVFDFFNILTTNGGNANVNDLQRETGNHHRWWQSAVQHRTDGDDDSQPNTLEYPSEDDHPSRAGNLKATGEFLALLNIYYHRFLAGTPTSTVLSSTTTSSQTSTSSSSQTSTTTSSTTVTTRPTTTTITPTTILPTTTTSSTTVTTRPTTTTVTSTTVRPSTSTSTTTTVRPTTTTTAGTTTSSTTVSSTTTTLRPAGLERFYPRAVIADTEMMGVAAVNYTSVDATLSFRLHDSAGTLLAESLHTLSPRSQLARLLPELFPSRSAAEGWMRLVADQDDIESFYLFFDNRVTWLDGALATAQAARDLVLPAPPGAAVSLANPSDSPADFVLEFRDAGGAVRSSRSGRLPGKGSVRFAPGSAQVSGAEDGYWKVAAGSPVVGAALWGPTSWCAAVTGMPPAAPSSGPWKYFAPQYATGAGWSSALRLVNTAARPNSITLQLTGDDGRRVGVIAPVNLPVLGAMVVDGDAIFGLAPHAQLQQGYVTAESTSPFVGAVVFSDERRESFASALPLTGQISTETRFGHIADNQDYYTGVAVLNPSLAEVTVEVSAWDAEGSLLGTGAFALAPGARRVGLLPQILGAPLNATSGYFQVTAGQPVAGFALFGTRAGDALAAIPATVSPVPEPCSYSPGFVFREIANPLAGAEPAITTPPAAEPRPGDCFPDARFGTRLRRLTLTDGALGRHEYSRFDPWSSDYLRLILLGDTFTVYRATAHPFNTPARRARDLALLEPRWDPTRPRRVWGIDAFRILAVDVDSGQEQVIKDFSQDTVLGPLIARGGVYRVTTLEEGEASTDFRFWALCLQADESRDYAVTHIFTWDRVQDRILGIVALESTERDLDWVGMSPFGNWVLIGGMDYNGGRFVGMTLADRELKRFHRIDFTTSHSDVGIDAAGREVLVMQNSRNDYVDMIPLSWETKPILEPEDPYAGTNRVRLLRLYYDSNSPMGLNSGVHISCNTPGYCVVSTTTEPGAPEQNWLDRSLVLVRLDPERPRAFYLAKLHNTTGSYFEETHASISRDGSRIVWTSNWGLRVGQEQVFLMELIMPPDWRRLTGSPQ